MVWPAIAAAGGQLAGTLASQKEGQDFGLYKDVSKAGSSYIGAPGTTGGVGQFAQPGVERGQNDLLGMLQAQAAGQGPSAARYMMQQGLGSLQSQIASIAAGASGSNRAAAQRQAMGQTSSLGADMLQKAGQQRASEQLASQSQLQGLLGGMADQGLTREQIAAQNYQAGLGMTPPQEGSDWKKWLNPIQPFKEVGNLFNI